MSRQLKLEAWRLVRSGSLVSPLREWSRLDQCELVRGLCPLFHPLEVDRMLFSHAVCLFFEQADSPLGSQINVLFLDSMLFCVPFAFAIE